MKKLLILCSVVLLLLVGCGQSSNTSDVVEVTMLQGKTEIAPHLEKLAAKYSEENEGVNVTILGSGEDVKTNLQSSLSLGEGPTIFTNFGYFDEMLEYMAPLDDMQMNSNVSPGLTDMTTKDDGHVYGLPVSIEGIGLYYNKDLMTEVGLTEADFATTDLFVESCKKVQQKGFKCVEMAPDYGFVGEHYFNTAFASRENPYQFIDEVKSGDKDILKDESFTNFMKISDSIKETGNQNLMSSSYDNQINEFANKKSLFMHQGNWAIPVLEEYNVDFTYGFMPVPIGESAKFSAFVPAFWSVNNQSTDEEIQAAKDFLDWMHNDPEAQKVMIEEMQMIPAYTNFDDELISKLSPINQPLYEAVESDNYLVWGLYYLDQSTLQSMGEEMQMYFGGEEDITTALTNLQEDIKADEFSYER